MFYTLKKLRTLLTDSEFTRAKFVFILMLGMASLETLGVASIMPFVSVLANPEAVETNPYLTALYDYIGFSNTQTFLFFLGIVVLFLFVSTLVFKALTTYAIARFSFMRLHSISCRLLEAYLRQPYEFFLSRNTADLSKVVLSEVQQVTGSVLIPFLRILSGGVVAIAIVTLLLVVEPQLSLIVAITLGGAYSGIYLVTRKLLHRIGTDRLRANEQRFVLANEALSGVKELRLLGREDVYLERFKDPSERFARHQATNQVIGVLPHYGIQAIAFGGILIMMLYLLSQRGGIQAALPLVAVYAFAGYRLMPAFQEIFRNLTQLRFSLPALDALCDDLSGKESKALNRDGEKTATPIKLTQSIRLEKVSYQYPGSKILALEDLTLTIFAGTSVAFVGSTGAGKTTAIDLILGLLEPAKGTIFIDDEPLHCKRLHSWQRNIGYVPQSIYLVDDTVTANIAFGVTWKDIDLEAVERAARAAHIHEFVVGQLQYGYDTIVGERGVRLSGGQRQRLAIARALYHDPDVVVFDEATSALDSSTEAAVMEAIEELHGQKTVLLIAHRLSTVRSCDQIHVLENGRRRASGSYSELMSSSKSFQHLARASSI